MIFLFALVLCQTTVCSQQYSLKGKVVNQGREMVAFAHVSLLKGDSITIMETAADSLGNFSMEAEKGVYRLIVEVSGAECANREITLLGRLDLGEIVIGGSVELGGVTVSARKKKLVEQKSDRLVFNVENAVSATGGTALDALKATPTVKVQNDNISIIGKGGVLVMIDDRLLRVPQEELASFLKTIPSDNIRRIEVITTPPAKYDAEGNNGLINIQLKTARANSWNANVGSAYTQKTYAGGNIQGLFNYNYKNVSMQVSVNKGSQDLLVTSESRIFYTDELWSQQESYRSKNDLLNLGLGIDYKLAKRWSTGISYLGSFTNRISAGDQWTTRFSHATGEAGSFIESELGAASKPEMSSLNWHHAWKLDSLGKNITMDLDHFNYRKKDQSAFAGNTLDAHGKVSPGTFFSATNININRISNYSGKIDVALPYKWADVSLGAKVSYTNTNNDLTVYDNQSGTPVLDAGQSNVFNYTEHNEALYFSVGKKLSKQWESQLGVRMEATQTEGYSENLEQTNKNNYIRLFPTAYVTYVPNDRHTFSLNYSQRIRRPDFDYLNPFVVRTNPYSYSEGNPFLKPSFINNIEFSYIKDQKWVSSVYFSQVSDFGQELSIVDESTNITRITPVNYADTYQAGVSASFNFNKSRWSSFTGVNINYESVRSKTGFIESVDGYNAYVYSNNDFTLNKAKSVFLGLNYGLQLPGRYQIFHISAMNIMSVSMKFLMLKKKLSLSVIAEDLLNGQRPLISYVSNGIMTNVQSYGDTRGFRIALSYKFGNNNLKSGPESSGKADEQERVK